MGKPMKPPEISGLEDHLGFWLRFVSNAVSGRFEKLVDGEGVTVSEWVALRQIYGETPVTSGELVAALGLTKGAISKVLGRLETKGLLRRTEDETDRRVQVLVLTEQGRELVPRLAALADENDRYFFANLPTDTQKTLRVALQAIVREQKLVTTPVD